MSVSVHIQADPLGPVNKIVTLARGGQRVKSVLCRVPVGATVRLVRDEGSWTIRNLHALRKRAWDSRGSGEPEPSIEVRPPGWRVEVDDRTVLTVPDFDPSAPYVPPPPPPLWRRMRTVLREQARADADWIAGRLGYHRSEDCTGWDE